MPLTYYIGTKRPDAVTHSIDSIQTFAPAVRARRFGLILLVAAGSVHGPLIGAEGENKKVLTEWSDLKGVEGFEDLEGFDDPNALDGVDDLKELEQFEQLLEGEDLDLDLNFELPTWDFETTLKGSLGYKHNILLQPESTESTEPIESSGFWRTGLEMFLWRLPEGRTEFILMADATDVRYFHTDETDGEQTAFLHGAFNWLATDWSKLSLKGQVVYQDQVLDMSANERYPYIGQVQVFSYNLDPVWEVSLNRNLTVALTGIARADRFRQGPDDFDDLGGRIGVGYRFGLWGELDLRYTVLNRDYATRIQYTAGGRPLVGTSLSIDQQNAVLRFRIGTGTDARWKLRTKLAWLQYRDNGSGYFDYDRSTVGLELTWSPGPWLFVLGGDFHRYDYLVQTVWVGQLENRRKDDFFATLRVERPLTESLRWHFEGLWESSETNAVYGTYDAGSFFTGVGWTF